MFTVSTDSGRLHIRDPRCGKGGGSSVIHWKDPLDPSTDVYLGSRHSTGGHRVLQMDITFKNVIEYTIAGDKEDFARWKQIDSLAAVEAEIQRLADQVPWSQVLHLAMTLANAMGISEGRDQIKSELHNLLRL